MIDKLTSREIKQKETNVEDQKYNSQINTRAALLSFYNGTGGQDVGSMAIFFGFPGGRNWERQFHRTTKNTSVKILEVVDKIIHDSLEDEVILVMKAMLSDKNMTEAIDENIKLFKSGEYEQIYKDLQKIEISITYDMG